MDLTCNLNGGYVLSVLIQMTSTTGQWLREKGDAWPVIRTLLFVSD